MPEETDQITISVHSEKTGISCCVEFSVTKRQNIQELLAQDKDSVLSLIEESFWEISGEFVDAIASAQSSNDIPTKRKAQTAEITEATDLYDLFGEFLATVLVDGEEQREIKLPFDVNGVIYNLISQMQ